MSSDSGDTRTKILDSARALLEQRGASARMQDIADRAGVSRQAVYLHFPNRVALLTGLVAWLDEERYDLAEYMAAVERVEDPVERLAAFVDAALRYQPVIAPVGQALMDATTHGDEAAAAAFEDRMQGRLQGCRARIVAVQRADRLAAGLDVDTATDLLWVLIGFPTWLDLTVNRGWSADRTRHHLVRMARRALVADP